MHRSCALQLLRDAGGRAISTTVDVSARRATSIDLFRFNTVQMRAFHMTWLAFFVCFYAWFAAAPLMPVIARQFDLSSLQVANINIAAVLVTVVGRLIIGPLCDKFGPRRTYTWLLILGSLPVFGLAFAQSYASLLFFRLLIGFIGASFVISQYHASVMFAPNVVGTANATVGGWGNAGAGVAQAVMAPLATLAVSLGVEQQWGWRAALLVPGVAMLIMAVCYARFTQDLPQGNLEDVRRAGLTAEGAKKGGLAAMGQATRNYRTWLLAACYGGSFGIEIFIHNIAATYYVHRFGLSLASAGLAAGTFGLLALFARPLGGLFSDMSARRFGLEGRTSLLFGMMICEGGGLLMFSHAPTAAIAVMTMLFFGVFLHMSAGAVYSLMPFIDRKVMGGVCGVIGAGGNVGAVLAALLNRQISSQRTCFMILGGTVLCLAFCALCVRFSAATRASEQALYDEAIAQRMMARGMALGSPGGARSA